MRVLTVHNRYRLRGGEDAVVDNTHRILSERGVASEVFLRESGAVAGRLSGKLRALFSGVYARGAAAELRSAIRRFRPDVVHVHNVYPLLSPSVFPACAAEGVPAVLTCHNYRLTCPIGSHFIHGALCTRCLGGREQWCLLRNCRGSLPESAAYALRGFAASRGGWFRGPNISYIAISAYLRDFLVREASLPAERVHVVPNATPMPSDSGAAAHDGAAHIAFAGRLSEEKGLPLLLEAARAHPDLPIRIAGDGPLRRSLEAEAPANVAFLGMLAPEALDAFYREARCVVTPSVWRETFGLVAIEAMGRGIPVIAAGHGGLRELVRDQETGLLFTPGDAADLAAKLRWLWDRPETAAAMGARAREHARREYSEDNYFTRLMAVYESARAAEPGKAA